MVRFVCFAKLALPFAPSQVLLCLRPTQLNLTAIGKERAFQIWSRDFSALREPTASAPRNISAANFSLPAFSPQHKLENPGEYRPQYRGLLPLVQWSIFASLYLFSKFSLVFLDLHTRVPPFQISHHAIAGCQIQDRAQTKPNLPRQVSIWSVLLPF